MQKYRKGFSITNLKYFRSFYQVYAERKPHIRHEPSGQLVDKIILFDNSETVQGFGKA